MTYSLPELLDVAVNAKLTAMRSANIVQRIWNNDATVWTDKDEDKWLGWLTIAAEELAEDLDEMSAEMQELKKEILAS